MSLICMQCKAELRTCDLGNLSGLQLHSSTGSCNELNILLQKLPLVARFDCYLNKCIDAMLLLQSGLIAALYDDLKPKANRERDERPVRPSLAVLQDLEEERKERLLTEKIRR